MWRRIWESNPGHISGRGVLSPLRHPCTDNFLFCLLICLQKFEDVKKCLQREAKGDWRWCRWRRRFWDTGEWICQPGWWAPITKVNCWPLSTTAYIAEACVSKGTRANSEQESNQRPSCWLLVRLIALRDSGLPALNRGSRNYVFFLYNTDKLKSSWTKQIIFRLILHFSKFWAHDNYFPAFRLVP